MAGPNESLEVAKALAAALDTLPVDPKVVDMKFSLGVDDAGDPAVFVLVLLDDSTSDEEWISPKLEPIAQRFREAIQDAGVNRWPYVRFARQSDLKAAG